MPPRRSILPEARYRRVRYLQLNEDQMRAVFGADAPILPGQKVYHEISIHAADPLTEDQKQDIINRCGKGSHIDWDAVENARQHFTGLKRLADRGADYKQLSSEVEKLHGAALNLLSAMDWPPKEDQPETKTEHAVPTIHQHLWMRFEAVRDPRIPEDQPIPTREEIYPVISKLCRQLDLVKEDLAGEQRRGPAAEVAPWNGFVSTLADMFQAREWKPTAPKPVNWCDAKPSPFVTFVAAVWDTLPGDVQEGRSFGSDRADRPWATIIDAVDGALASWRKSTKGS